MICYVVFALQAPFFGGSKTEMDLKPSPRLEAGPSTSVEELMRTTAEYAAAFDVEVWKAQQQARFRAQLRQSKDKLEERITAELERKQQKRIQELESTRQELEEMARRLRSAEAMLQQRTAELEARETAFEARRVRVAAQHESHLSRVEERAKRAVEEQSILIENLRRQLSEKDVVILQLQERVSCAETEYDVLRRKAARYVTQPVESDGKRVKDLELQVSTLNATVQEAQGQLRRRTDDLRHATMENASLQQQLRHSRQQVEEMMEKQKKLQEELFTRERFYLQEEHRRLERARRGVGGRDVTFPYTAEGCSSQPADNSSDAGRDDLLGMLHKLKKDVVAGLQTEQTGPTRASHTRGSAATPPEAASPRKEGSTASKPYVYAERMIDSSSVPNKAGEGDGAAVGGGEVVVPGSHPPSVTAVAPAATEPPGPISPVSSKPENTGDGVPEPAVSGTVNTSTSSAYPRVEVRSWHSSGDEDDNQGSLPHCGRALPPLAPPTREAPATVPPTVSPLPEEFVRASETSLGSATATTNADMRAFVEQLKINRQKLLDTEVYTEDHAVVREMSEKIKLYEQYLAEHS